MSRKYVLVVSSVVAHGFAVVALVVAGWWSIEKLEYEGESDRIAFYPVPPDRPMPGGGDGEVPPLKAKKKGSEGQTQHVRKAVNDVQPAPLLEEDLDAVGDQGGDEDSDEDGELWGHKYGSPDGTGTGLFTGDGDCRMPECGSGIPTKVDIKDPPKDEIVPPEVLTANRKGDGKIQPPESVKVDMVRAGETQIRAAVKICVTTGGKVHSASFIKKTGYDAYDAKLLREIRKWEYRPFTIDGKAVPYCSVTHIIFRLR